MPPAKGAKPGSHQSDDEASAWIRAMFGRIAPRYDLANRVLSMQIDRWWRFRTVIALGSILARPEARIADLCCGTGDLTIALARRAKAKVAGADFAHPMLLLAASKAARKHVSAKFFEADAMCLPFADGSLDLVTMAFGFRNLVRYDDGLREIHRVLRPGGTMAILEFSHPPNALFRAAYEFYSSRLLPRLGGWLTGHRSAYSYLPSSVGRFPAAPELAERMRAAGFHSVTFRYFTGGIAALHLGQA